MKVGDGSWSYWSPAQKFQLARAPGFRNIRYSEHAKTLRLQRPACAANKWSFYSGVQLSVVTEKEHTARPVLPKAPLVLAKALKPRLVLIF